MKRPVGKSLLVQLPLLALLIVGTVWIISRHGSQPYQRNTGYVFGTVYHITYQHGSDLEEDIAAALDSVDATMSMFNSKSELSRVNRGEKVAVNDMFAAVFTLSERVSETTNGAFDATVAPLVNAWGFGFKKGELPSRSQVDSIKAFIGYGKARLVGRTVEKADPRVMLDFGAVAKGYGCDIVARLLSSHGVSNYMVEIGGEVVAKGVNPKSVPWRIGVAEPVEDSTAADHSVKTVVEVSDKAMATSGNYRNFYYRDGRKYSHTIDPVSGYPVQHSVLSATVTAPDCATADAYATAFMVMGLDRAKEVLARDKRLAAYIIYSAEGGEDAVWTTSNWPQPAE